MGDVGEEGWGKGPVGMEEVIFFFWFEGGLEWRAELVRCLHERDGCVMSFFLFFQLWSRGLGVIILQFLSFLRLPLLSYNCS